jgi:hypothetical protein
MKRVAVLFSGGLDSTYLVWKNLKEGNTVYPIYIELENNEVKTILEKNRIELLWKEFEKEFCKEDGYYDSKLKSIIYAIKMGIRANEGSLYFKQMPIWIFSAVFLQGMDNIDEIQIGYVSNDDAISYLEDVQNIYKSYQAISEPMKPLTFPLTKKKKWQIVHELPKQYLHLIVSCENARIVGSKDAELIEYEPCCECVPCKTIIASEYYGTGNYPDNYKKGLVQMYARYLYRNGYKIIDKDGIDYLERMSKLEPRKEPYQLVIDFDNKISCETEINGI